MREAPLSHRDWARVLAGARAQEGFDYGLALMLAGVRSRYAGDGGGSPKA